MEQKNTIVKCKAHPNCLFNHNGICDNYVINIGADGKCESYVETESEYDPPSVQEILEYTIKLEQEKLRGQRAKGNFIQDGIPQEIIDELTKPFEYYPTTRLQGHLGMCMWCDYHRSNCGCAHKNPDIDEEKRECYSIKSTGGNR